MDLGFAEDDLPCARSIEDGASDEPGITDEQPAILDFLWKEDHPDFPAKSVEYHSSRQLLSTPHGKMSAPGHNEGRTAEQQGKSIIRTLGKATVAGQSFIQHHFNQIPKRDINAWLYSPNGVYDAKKERWIGIPPEPKSEATLYSPIIKIISSILLKFVQPKCLEGDVKREVIDTHNKRLRHKENIRTSPDISIRATGSSFETPNDGQDIGYSNMATFFDVKLGSEINTEASRTQMSVYSQQVFAQQPNRWFVRCLLINEKYAQLLHFDRAGNQITRFIPYHEQPSLFVRIVIGISWATEKVLGLDESIQWKVGDDGKKKSGTLRTRSPSGRMEVYDLVDKYPVAHHIGICGPSATCWSVRDRVTGKMFYLKDFWSSQDRTPEWEHFDTAEGVVGVARMVAKEGPRAYISSFRCKSTLNLDLFDDRQNVRVLLEAYGDHIDKYKNPLQLLLALRDAIAGHARLLGKGVVHRNISNKNILLGITSEGSHPADGFRGVLIDLGQALNITNCGLELTKDTLTGSRFCQSCMTLEYLTSSAIGPPPAHDYLDDLESFFHVFCRMLFLKRPDGQDRPLSDRARHVVKGWDSEDADDALPPKALLFDPKRSQRLFAAALVHESWGPECKMLFEDYRSWVCKIQGFKASFCPDPPNSFDVPEELRRFEPQSPMNVARKSRFSPLYVYSRLHYRQVVGYFNKAIAGLMQAENAPAMVAYEPTIPQPDLASIAERLRSRKRPAEIADTASEAAPSTSLPNNDRPRRSRTGRSRQ